MKITKNYSLTKADFFTPPWRIEFNQDVMAEASIALGRDDTLRIFCDADSLNKFEITISIKEKNQGW